MIGLEALFCTHDTLGYAWVASSPSGYFLTAMICDDCYTFMDFDAIPSWITPIFLGENHIGGVLVLQWI